MRLKLKTNCADGVALFNRMKNNERKEKTKLIENRRNRIIINVLKIKSKELQSRLISANEIVAATTTTQAVAAGNVCYLFAYTCVHTHTHDSCDRNVDVDCGARLSTPFPFRKTKWIAL